MGMYGGAYGNNLDSPFVRQAEVSLRSSGRFFRFILFIIIFIFIFFIFL